MAPTQAVDELQAGAPRRGGHERSMLVSVVQVREVRMPVCRKRSANPSIRQNLKLRTFCSLQRQGKRGGDGSGTDGAVSGAGVGVSGVGHEGQGVGGGQWGGVAVAAELVCARVAVAGAAG